MTSMSGVTLISFFIAWLDTGTRLVVPVTRSSCPPERKGISTASKTLAEATELGTRPKGTLEFGNFETGAV